MRKEKFCEVLGDISENYVEEARADRKARKPVWLKWGVMAACLCLAAFGALTVPNLRNEPIHGQLTTEQVYTLPQSETMSVELVAWGGDHFKGIVVDAGDNSIFPVDAELSVVFDYDTEILLDDGSLMVFNPDEPDTDVIGWEEGMIITVKFVNYADYKEGNHFYNQVYASYVELTK